MADPGASGPAPGPGANGPWTGGDGPDRREERRGSFGAAAGSYEAGRPGYSAPTIDAVLDYAALGRTAAGAASPIAQATAAAADAPNTVNAGSAAGDGLAVLEVGAGTGKATVALAARGLAVTCLEPDPLMAAALRRNIRGFPRVVVAEATLEGHSEPDAAFDLVLAAQSWHWVDPARRLDLARRALRSGGALALLWNSTLLPPGRLQEELRAVHSAHGTEAEGAHTLRDPFPPPDDVWETTPPGRELSAHPRFSDLRVRTILVEYVFTTRRYLDYLDSLSRYRILPSTRRSALFADVARVTDAHGGRFAVTTYELAMLARASG